ncbi:nitroreductase/quinone reductase family protein [Streptomyces sp. NPDC051018]|uniref:nitroreductase/quinone reductase family protein n=1 Tax=Streptomyces sp. NPDC051018 TaxID=3365639 RepID=UPI0037A634C2
MSIRTTPTGTRGARTPSLPRWLSRFVQRRMSGHHRRKGDTFMGMDVLYLTTTGAKSGKRRETPVARFPDGEGAWLVVASLAGAARHPGWYHNIAAHPDRVRVEIGGRRFPAVPEQLEGGRREEAWRRIVAAQPRYAEYQEKTDRVLPVIRLTAVE